MKPVIYQIFVRLFGNKSTEVKVYGTIDENGCGKFEDINESALNSLKDFGITHIWYTGIIEHAVANDYSQFGIENDYPEIVKGRAGSPYAIKDYYDVNPDLANDIPGRMREFDELVTRTHAAGMKVIIDFVPNHLARLYKSDEPSHANKNDFGANDTPEESFSAKNDFYYLPGEGLKLPDEVLKRNAVITDYRKNPSPYTEFPARATGNDCFRPDPGIGDWYETVKLNYGIDYLNGKQKHFQPLPPVWEKMKSVILYWASHKVDGFRVDMAEMVPLEFWEWLIPVIKYQYSEIIFIAEIYQPHLYKDFIETGGFDFLYDKIDFYESTRNVIEGKEDIRSFTRCWQRIGQLEKNMLRFLENHDEQRIASRFFAGNPWKGIPGIVLATTMNSGPLLLYFGQEVGEPAEGSSGFSGDDGRTSIFDYWTVPNLQIWMNGGEFNEEALPADLADLRNVYGGIIRLCHDHRMFSQGGFYDLMWINQEMIESTNARIFAYVRYDNRESSVIILNFSNVFYRDVNLYIPEDACKLMHCKEGSNLVEIISFPSGNDFAIREMTDGPLKYTFNIAPHSAIIMFLESF